MVESIKELRKICYEGDKSPPSLYNTYVCMKFSIYITKALLYTKVTANQVTYSMLLLGIIGSIFLFNGHFIVGFVLLHLSVVLDDVDGEIARYRKKRSMKGMSTDVMYHAVTNPLMLFGFAYGIYNLFPNNFLLIFGFLSAVFSQSIVVPCIFDAIISMRIRGEKAPKISKNITGKEVIEYEGKTKEYRNPLLMIYHFARNFFIYPSNLVMITLIYIWEVVNLKYAFAPKFLVTILFFVAYGSYGTLNNILSFIFHSKKNSIDSFYVFIFGKK